MVNTSKYWAAMLIAVLLLPSVAASADAAKEAYEKGKACLEKHDYDAAIDAFTEAIRLDPENAEAYWNRALAYNTKDEKAKAGEDFARAKELGYKPQLLPLKTLSTAKSVEEFRRTFQDSPPKSSLPPSPPLPPRPPELPQPIPLPDAPISHQVAVINILEAWVTGAALLFLAIAAIWKLVAFWQGWRRRLLRQAQKTGGSLPPSKHHND